MAPTGKEVSNQELKNNVMLHVGMVINGFEI
jgi:hypothetical protein